MQEQKDVETWCAKELLQLFLSQKYPVSKATRSQLYLASKGALYLPSKQLQLKLLCYLVEKVMFFFLFALRVSIQPF